MTDRWSRALAATLVLATPAVVEAQSKPTQEEIAKLQAIYMESMQPGPEHERLKRQVGHWDQEIRMWPEPGAEPMTFTGSAEGRMILGNRFLVMEAALGEGEMRAETMMIFGFDRRNGWYTSAAYDTQGTYHVAAHGTWDAALGAIVMHGKDTVVAAGHTQTWDFVVRAVDDDTYVFEIIFTDPVHTRGGAPFKMVEVTSRRRN